MEKAYASPPYDIPDSLPFSLSKIFDVPRKTAVIQLRWPVVISCAYLLLLQGDWALSLVVKSLLIFYLFSNAVLYITDTKVFDRPYFFAALAIFDTLFLTASLIVIGAAGTKLYFAYFFVLFLCGICHDFRGLILTAVLAPIVYGYLLFQASESHSPGNYLQIPFLFVITIFFGYLAQLVRVEKAKSKQAHQEAQKFYELYTLSQSLLESVRRKSEEFETLVKINRDIAALLDRDHLLTRVTEEATKILKMEVANFRLIEGEHLNLVSSSHPDEVTFRPRLRLGESLSGKVIRENCVVALRDVVVDPTIIEEHREMLRKAGYHSYLGVPLQVGGRVIGAVNLLSRQERKFSPEDIGLMMAFADQAAIAITNANLFAEVRKTAFALEKSNSELQEACRAKSKFMAAMSHELRTPLNVIIGNTELLRDGFFGDINEKQAEAAGKANHHSQVLLRLISDVLTFTKAEIKTDISTVNLEEIMSSLQPYIDHLNRDNRLEVLWQVEKNLPPITTDALKLEQILQNLIGNAFKYTPQGRVEIRVKNIPGKKRIEFAIADTGIGIKKEDLGRIFEEFYQHDDAHTGSYNGVGLGLSIVKRYLELMHGEIRVDTKPGKGSTFTFTLPYSLGSSPMQADIRSSEL